MCTLRIPLFVLLLALVAVGCDSNDDDDDGDRERFFGSWSLAEVTDEDGEPVEGSDETNLSVIFQEDGTAILTANDIVLTGTFEIDEGDDQLTVTAPGDEVAELLGLPLAGDLDLEFGYRFEGDNTVGLTPSGDTATILNLALDGISIDSGVTISLNRDTGAAA